LAGTSCTIDGETRREGYRNVTGKPAGAVLTDGIFAFGSPPRSLFGESKSASRWIPRAICDTLSYCRQGTDFL
jgi:hypothetical protein